MAVWRACAVLFILSLTCAKSSLVKDESQQQKELQKELDSIELQSAFNKESDDSQIPTQGNNVLRDLLKADLMLSVAEKRSEECKDKRQDCKVLKQVGICSINKEVAQRDCPLTCAVCKPSTDEEPICKDLVQNCQKLKDFMKCSSEKMVSLCRQTCRHCVVCKDAMNEERCRVYRDTFGLCQKTNKFRSRMEKLCYKTCGFCRQSAPPKCQTSDFGCCWDNATEKFDPEGSNCPRCVNDYPHTCTTFADSCWKYGTQEPFMKKHCPKQCGFCIAPCQDDATYDVYCPIWKKSKYCALDYEIREHLCPKTCGSCS